MEITLKKELFWFFIILIIFIVLSIAVGQLLKNYIFGLFSFPSLIIPTLLVHFEIMKGEYLVPVAAIIFGILCVVFFGFNEKYFLLFMLNLVVYLVSIKLKKP